ncbi:MAG: hypothetical protein KA998_04830 [Rickettsiaceae bacterium]|nr:hypothetical protein [Rickettsiaceae bacterium]
MSKKNINEEELLARQIMLMNTFITLIPEEKKTVYTTYKQRLVTKLKNDLGPAIKDFKAGDDLIKTLVDNNPNIDSLLYDGEEGSRAVDEIKLKLQDWKVSLALSGLRVKNSDINALRSNSKALIAFVKKFDSNIPDINLGNQNEQPGKTIPANVTMLLDTPIEGNFSNASTEILEQLLNSETFCAAVENFINERESKKQQEVVVDAIEQPQTQENKQEVSVVERHRSDSMPTSNAITENPAAENPVVSKVAETETYYTTTVPETEASSKETPAAPQTVTAEEAQPTQKAG